MKWCLYCDQERDAELFSNEHIWPEALGGDYLDSFWRTNDVCRRCNSLAGVFVDGAYIKSFFGVAERSHGADAYMPLDEPEKAALPFSFLGTVVDDDIPTGEVCEYWAGRCGMTVFHFRPANAEPVWDQYSGGDPRRSRKKGKVGQAYLAVLSKVPFWVEAAVASFRGEFSHAEMILATKGTFDVRPGFTAFDPNNPVHLRQARLMERHLNEAPKISARSLMEVDTGFRFLAKVALGIGFRIFGTRFSSTSEARQLRTAFREADFAKRQALDVRIAPLFGDATMQGLEKRLHWDGGWVLLLRIDGEELCLFVITPMGKFMAAQICADPSLVRSLPKALEQGLVWLTIPALGQGTGPIWLPRYLGHMDGKSVHPDLALLAEKRHPRELLPDCGLGQRAPEDQPSHNQDQDNVPPAR